MGNSNTAPREPARDKEKGKAKEEKPSYLGYFIAANECIELYLQFQQEAWGMVHSFADRDALALRKSQRESIGNLLKEYRTLLEKTVEVGSQLVQDVAWNISTLESLATARALLLEGAEEEARILLAREPFKTYDTSVIGKLLEDLGKFVEAAQKAQLDARKWRQTAQEKKFLFLGLMAVSGLMLMLSLGACVCCCTLIMAPMGIVAGGVGAVASTIGLTSGMIGCQRYEELEKIAASFENIAKEMTSEGQEMKTEAFKVLALLRSAKSAEAQQRFLCQNDSSSEQEVVTKLLVRETSGEQIEAALEQSKLLQTQAEVMRDVALEKISQYSQKFQDVEWKLEASLQTKNLADSPFSW